MSEPPSGNPDYSPYSPQGSRLPESPVPNEAHHHRTPAIGYPAQQFGHHPVVPTPQNGMGTTALVLGIVGAATSWIPILACLGWIACVLAIVFGAIGLSRSNNGKATNRSSAIAGLVLGIASLLIGVILIAAVWGTLVPASSTASSVESSTEEDLDGRTEAVEEGEVAAEADEEETVDEPEEEPGLGAGLWEVGPEIAPGTYVTTAEEGGVFDGCYVARLAGFSGEFDDIIANTNIGAGSRSRITIDESDVGVEFSGDCKWMPAGESNLAEPGAEVGDGVWEVGTEVQPGTYVTQVEGDGIWDSCYVARLSGFSFEFEDIISNDNIDGGAQGRITVEPSDVGVEFSGGCVWALD